MKKNSFLFLLFFLLLFGSQVDAIHSAALLPSTEGDPDGFIDECVCVINGDYCESSTDLAIVGPDILFLQRYYNAKNYITGKHAGGWRLFTTQFLIVGKDPKNYQSTLAFTGERSGGIFTYSGWRKSDGTTEEPLKIDLELNGLGIVNTYAKNISGQTNHKNNFITCKEETCELFLGDGTKRIYKKVARLPNQIFGEELLPFLSEQVLSPEYYHLIEEILPSGNRLHLSYDTVGHVSHIEMKNASNSKTISWIHFDYELQGNSYLVKLSTSDEKTVNYHFSLLSLPNGFKTYVLTQINGSHIISCSYEYEVNGNLCTLVKKIFPDGSFKEINYDQEGRVKGIKEPALLPNQTKVKYAFHYAKNYTDVFDATGLKTRYLYNEHSQLIEVAKYDQKKLYRSDLRFWGNQPEDKGLLLARAVADGNRVIHSYHSYHYDTKGNILEECLYGDLTGRESISLVLNVEGKVVNSDEIDCHRIRRSYSEDGFNLLTKIGSSQESQTVLVYQSNTHFLIKELSVEKKVRKRIFHFYNEDGARIKTIEDDGYADEENVLDGVTERHIVTIQPKKYLPGVGLPEAIDESGLNLSNNQEILFRRRLNIFDAQGRILRCDTCDSEGQFAHSELKSYNSFGLPISETNLLGQVTTYTYDSFGNPTSISIPHDHKDIQFTYDQGNHLIRSLETIDGQRRLVENSFDAMGRKTSSIDMHGNITSYIYDEFGRLTQVIFPEVYDENENTIQPKISCSYDIFDNIISTTDPNGYVTYKSYTLRGEPSKIIYPDGSIELYKYDRGGSLHRKLCRDQSVTNYEYDYQGRVTREQTQICSKDKPIGATSTVEYEYNGFHCKLKTLNRRLATQYEYDSIGRPISIIQSDKSEKSDDLTSRHTEIFYDNLGNIGRKKVWFDVGPEDYSLEVFNYDLTGRVIEKSVEDAQASVLLQRTFSYDIDARATEEYGIVDGKKTTLSRTTHDFLGESSIYTDAQGNETKVKIDNAYCNALGQKVIKKIITNSFGVRTEVEFDALGRIAKILKKDEMDALLSLQRILYDASSNKCQEINAEISQGNVIGSQSTFWKYGPMNHLEAQIDDYGSPQERKTYFEYNSFGQMIAKIVPGFAKPLTYSYNHAGKIDSIIHKDANLPVEQQVANFYTYDENGNIVQAKGHRGVSVSREYNAFDQITKESVSDGENGFFNINYIYDRQGRIISITLPDKSAIHYKYNALFGTEIKRLTADGKELYSHQYKAYDESGRILSESFNDKEIIEHRYDLNGNTTEINTPFLVENYSYDQSGRIIKKERKNNSTVTFASYAYTDLAQLCSERGSHNNEYRYDSLDNTVQINGIPLAYTANQLTSYSNAKYQYDPQGNLLRKTLDQQETRFKNNILSQLIQIEKPDHSLVSFIYDPLGRRLFKKHVQGPAYWAKVFSTQHFMYLDDVEIGTINEKGKIQELRIPGLASEGLSYKSIAIEIKGKPYATVHDHCGNLAALVDPISHTIAESYSYSAFGKELVYNSAGDQIAESSLNNPWRYAEKRVDKETGLIFFGLRYYDPQINRWINPDLLGKCDGPNEYAYTRNNPLNCLDNFGLETESVSTVRFEHFFYGDEEHYYKYWGTPPNRYCIGNIYHRSDMDNSQQLPKIVYSNSFEDKYPQQKRSRMFDLGLQDYPDMGIGFINGIKNSYEEARESASYISDLANGANVHGVYNGSYNSPRDLFGCFLGLNFIATPPVHYLHQQWDNFFGNSSSDANFLQICQSQGAIHVRNALLDYSPELRERILVVAIAPGGYIYNQTCGQVVHYRVLPFRDLVPYIDLIGMVRERDTTLLLKSHPHSHLHDHNFQSPTYKEALRYRIDNYLQSKGKGI